MTTPKIETAAWWRLVASTAAHLASEIELQLEEEDERPDIQDIAAAAEVMARVEGWEEVEDYPTMIEDVVEVLLQGTTTDVELAAAVASVVRRLL